LQKATQKKTKTKIVLTDGRVERFNYLHFEDQQYFGTRKTGNVHIRIPIDEGAVNEVRVKNKRATDVINIGAVGIVVIGGIIYGASNCCGQVSLGWE
jgi:hypothetical protein